ncbi:MAG: hypothetical protein GY720_23645 [bacterium]|nr:hypothetical protein [bacterium]
MRNRRANQLGEVAVVQVQPEGLIIDRPDTPTGSFYDSSRRVEVDRLVITSKGIEATLADGTHVLDVHHLSHPRKAYDDDDLVCIGFTSHYESMRSKFGAHMVDGIAGENIVIDTPREIWPEDIHGFVEIENQDTSDLARLSFVSFAAPCVEFSQFCAQNQHVEMPKDELRETLRFLGRGRRGFLLVLDEGQDAVTVRPGDRVFTAPAPEPVRKPQTVET